MKNNKKIALTGLTFVVVGLVVAMGAARIQGNDVFSVITNTKKIEKTGDFSSEKINEITVNADMSRVVISESEGNLIHYYYKGDERIKFEVNEKNNKLELKAYDTRYIWAGFSSFQGLIEVQLPKKKYDSLKINAAVGSVLVKDNQFDAIDIKSDVGSVDIENLKVNTKMLISSDVGKVTISDVKNPKNVDIVTNIGAIYIDDLLAENIKIESDIGSVEINEMYAKRVKINSNIGSINYYNTNKNFKFEKLDIDSDIGDKNIDID